MTSFNAIAKQTGVALITVMLVVAFAVVIATKMSGSLMFQLQRAENINSNQQAYWYAMGAEAFAKTVLTLSFKEKDDKTVTHLGQPWASGETSFPVELGEISGEISDSQSCFNLNSLINSDPSMLKSNNELDTGGDNEDDEQNGNSGKGNNNNPPPAENDKPNSKVIKNVAKQSFIELIILLNIDGVGQFEAESMAEALYDWLDEDSSIETAGGAEDDDYSAREFPYLAGNSKLASINELRLIEHFTPAAIFALKEHVCVIPNSADHKININTIDPEKPELLQALLGGVDQSVAEDIFSERGEKGFSNLSDFYSISAVSGLENFEQLKKQFVVDSSYFKLTTKTSFNDSYFSMNSIMKINKDETITVISRSIGAE
ncbi:type II secretion system minor pseudopilin GspK [Thalassotalea crassostreae]|uniref:type II secretion system minor pseudopilin GspK n=1 Tax=Thalassotalea crassostreae TaxID=1763536 RepID=UPI0008387C8B|nr:type II secretion system minor pseudopilin GspK [Thalassotalea crassostreae]